MESLIFIIILLLLAYFSYPLYVWCISIVLYAYVSDVSLSLIMVFIFISLFFIIKDLRLSFISKNLVSLIKRKSLLPKISNTEKAALEAGSNWVESNFFKAQVDYEAINAEKVTKLSKEEQDFLDNEVSTLCEMSSDWQIFQDRDLSPEIWKYIKDKKFFGMIIPKEYGGLGFSATAHSHIIEKLVSRSQVLAITIMVPNSLGPAELILKHGSKIQKEKYLNKLALGIEVPCFALTEPNAGSDATSITSSGVIFKDENNKLKIKLNFDKRYITLANIATLIGLAFVLKDPDHLLGQEENLGITFALISSKTKGVDNSKRHDPLNIPFVNSPLLGKDVVIDIKDIIGEENGIGQGWKMLVESLSIGRGISLPSVSLGGSKLALSVITYYTSLREQFGLSLSRFEAVEEKIAKIAAYTYMLNAARNYTLDAIDNGQKPGVVNSIMKYHATEKFREIINDAMDVLGGSAIMRGPNNLLAHAYFALPISITVEGANILTRNLMQFGQGLIKSHPFITKEIQAIEDDNIEGFDKAFFSHISLVTHAFAKSVFCFFTRAYFIKTKGPFKRYKQKLLWVSATYTLLTNIVLIIVGPALKKKENLSGRFGDILSYCYLITATLREFEKNPKEENKALVDYFCLYAFSEIQKAFEEILLNISVLKIFLPFLRLNPLAFKAKDSLNASIIKNLEKDENLSTLCDSVFISENKKDRLHLMKEAFLLNKKHEKEFKEIKKAVKEGKLKNDTMVNILDEAHEKEYINASNLRAMKRAYKIKQEVISVDSFKVREYKANK